MNDNSGQTFFLFFFLFRYERQSLSTQTCMKLHTSILTQTNDRSTSDIDSEEVCTISR